jgi:RHS repeat-associated protein
VKNSVVTKYYFAGATRIAVRTDGTLSYLLADHLDSSSLTTDANGVQTASALYKAFGETRYTLGALNTDYKFTGQREEASLGIYFFNARWFDPSLGRFTSPDTIVPTGTQGTQAWDRYAFVNNNPVRYTDPTGHEIQGDDPPPTPPAPPTPCSVLDPKCVNPPPPQTTIRPADEHPYGTHTEYETYMDWHKVDWFHLVTNGAGIVGDIATALVAVGFVPAGSVAAAGQVIDAVGIATDMIDVFTSGDISGVTWDGILFVAKETRFAKIVPVVGFGLNIDGFTDAWNAGVVRIPIQVPNPAPVYQPR